MFLISASGFFLLFTGVLTVLAHNENPGTWIAHNDSNELETEENSFFCNGYCIAMWKDGDCVSSGDHYWKMTFENDITLQALQLTNKEKFVKKAGYGDKFRQRIKGGTTVGILASFSNGKVKAYFKYDNQTLGQVFNLDTAILSSVCPAVRFNGAGRITIVKEDLPSPTTRKDPKNIVEIEGKWISYADNKNSSSAITGKEPRTSVATLSVLPLSNETVGEYIFDLQVGNDILLTVKTYSNGVWRSSAGIVSTRMAVSDFEYQLMEMLSRPDSVEFISGNLIVSKGNITVTFVR